MEVLDNDNVYSKAQAQQIVSNFFSNYPPNPEKKFDAIHISNGNEGSRSVIGVFESKKGDNFRISMLLKQSEENSYIQFLKIEKTQKPQ